MKRNFAIQIIAALVTVLALVAGFVAEPLFETAAPVQTGNSGTARPSNPATGTTAPTPTAGPYVPPPVVEPGENLNLAAAKARAEEIRNLSAQLEKDMAASNYASAANTMRALAELADNDEQKLALETDIAACDEIAEAEQLRSNNRFDKAAAVLYPIAADESRGKWSGIARIILTEMNSSRTAADSMLSAASSRMKSGKKDEALEILNRLVEKFPALPEAESARALINSINGGGR